MCCLEQGLGFTEQFKEVLKQCPPQNDPVGRRSPNTRGRLRSGSPRRPIKGREPGSASQGDRDDGSVGPDKRRETAAIGTDDKTNIDLFPLRHRPLAGDL